MNNCRVAKEERENDCGETTREYRAYLKKELLERINANDIDEPVVRTVSDMINEVMFDRCWHENRATSYCIDWYLDNHLCLVVDMVGGE